MASRLPPAPTLSLSLSLVLAVAIITTSVLAACPPFLRNQSACTCTEYVDGSIVKCSGPNGPQVVEELKKADVDVRELSLENANIVEIGSRAFRNLRVKKLTLDNNRIRTIQKDAFRGLEATLQELSINHNRLTEVPTEALEGLRALNVLSMRCNRIGNLTAGAATAAGGGAEESAIFQNLPSLIEVNLGCNKICEVGEKTFAEVKNSLQNLILDNNCMSQVPSGAIDGMQFLIALHMKYNQVEKLDFHQLANLSSLSMLTLTGNQISHISPNFTHNTPNLRYIYMAENNLTTLAAGTMRQFAQAEIIDLSFNNLPEITVDMFSGMENLQHLNLEANAIKDVAPGAFATTPLLLLWLPHNCLNSVSPNMFQGTPFLKQVSLAHNNIRQVQPFSFAHLANLHTLDLSHNKIQTMQPSAIMGSDFLTVRVQENPMVCSQDGFHVMNGREAINLTTEANLICNTDYVHDVNDSCPRRPVEGPVRQPCCEDHGRKPTTATTVTTTSTSATATAETPMQPVGVSESTQMQTTAEVNSARMSRYGKARKLNMDRFFRLSRRPTTAAPVIHSREEHAKQVPKNERTTDVGVDLVVPGNGEKVEAEETAPTPTPKIKSKGNEVPEDQTAPTTTMAEEPEQGSTTTETPTQTEEKKAPTVVAKPKGKARNIQSSSAVVEFSTDEHVEAMEKKAEATAPIAKKPEETVVKKT